MLEFLRRRIRARREPSAGRKLYFAVVAQSRLPAFYGSFGVPDTVPGRFDMVVLHAALVFRRLRAIGGEAEALSDAMFETMTADLDRSVREVGIGDQGVGKRVKVMASSFFGRARAYDAALGGIESLEDALRRNLYGTVTVSDEVVARMAGYVRAAAAAVAARSLADLADGNPGFPPTPYRGASG
jgi:cytochrome b pre-mRNA-processing protein 3